MEQLRGLVIDPNIPKPELISLLSSKTSDTLLDLHVAIFNDLLSKGLCNQGDELVNCRCSGNRALTVKLAASRTRSQQETAAPLSNPIDAVPPLSTTTNCSAATTMATSITMSEINRMKDSIKVLKDDINYIMRRQFLSSVPTLYATCHVFIKFSEPCSAEALPSFLGCGVLHSSKVASGFGRPKFIRFVCCSSCSTHSVRVWENNFSRAPSCPTSPLSPPTNTSISKSISVITWNCRGYHKSTPYLLNLISSGVDIPRTLAMAI